MTPKGLPRMTYAAHSKGSRMINEQHLNERTYAACVHGDRLADGVPPGYLPQPIETRTTRYYTLTRLRAKRGHVPGGSCACRMCRLGGAAAARDPRVGVLAPHLVGRLS